MSVNCVCPACGVNLMIVAGDKSKRKIFKKPTKDEAEAYALEIGFPLGTGRFNGQYFVDFYESKGWLIGKNKMKDWKATVRTWFSNFKNNNPDFVPQPKVSDATKASNKAARAAIQKGSTSKPEELF